MVGCCTRQRLIVLLTLLEAVALLYATRRLFRQDDNSYSSSSNHHDRLNDRFNETSRRPSSSTLASVTVGQDRSPGNTRQPFLDIQRMVDLVAPRPFPTWNHLSLPLPCPDAEQDWTTFRTQRSRTRTGILFVKVPKAGSSTGASISLRLASRIYQKSMAREQASRQKQKARLDELNSQQNQHNSSANRLCKNRVQHANTRSLRYDQRDRSQSVLWSVVRDPTDRALSEFFHFHVSRRGHNASDDSVFRDFVGKRRQRFRNFQVEYLSLRKLGSEGMHAASDRLASNQVEPSTSSLPGTVSVDTIRSILLDYDFVGVTERMDESVVVLQMLLGLETQDMLHMSSKVSGGYDDGMFHNRCTRIQSSFRTPAMDRFFSSPMWRRWTKWDAVLHRAVNRSLDLTIQALGPEKFRRQLESYQTMQRNVQLACTKNVRFPCDASRHDQPPRPPHETDCLLGDMGCGFECIDQHLATMAMP